MRAGDVCACMFAFPNVARCAFLCDSVYLLFAYVPQPACIVLCLFCPIFCVSFCWLRVSAPEQMQVSFSIRSASWPESCPHSGHWRSHLCPSSAAEGAQGQRRDSRQLLRGHLSRTEMPVIGSPWPAPEKRRPGLGSRRDFGIPWEFWLLCQGGEWRKRSEPSLQGAWLNLPNQRSPFRPPPPPPGPSSLSFLLQHMHEFLGE